MNASTQTILRTQPRRIAWAIALMLLTLLAGAALLGVAGRFLVATALSGAAIGFNFFAPSAGIRALTFVRILSRYFEKIAGHDATLRIASDLRVATFAKLLPLAPLELGRRRSGDVLARLLADVERVDGLLVRALGPLAALAALGLIACGVAFSLDLAVGALLLALLVFAFVLPIALDAFSSPLELHATQAREQLRSQLLDALEGATDLGALHAEACALDDIATASHGLERCDFDLRRRLALATAAHAKLLAWGLPLLAWLLFRATHAAQLSAPAAAGLWFMALAVLEACVGIAPAWQALREARASQGRLDEIAPASGEFTAASSALERKSLDAGLRRHDGQRQIPASGALELRDVTFRWDATSRDVLHHANLKLAPGQRIALRGDSGTGKSSLFALLLGLREPDAGSIAFAGIDLRDFDPAQWHARIAWLPQDAPVFSGSVRDNLLLGAPDAEDAQLWAALRDVQLDDAIEKTGGLDAWVGPSGATLSAGQSRRLALARALLREAPLLLLDEPGEGLDADTAHAFFATLAENCLRRGQALLLITHGELPPGVVDAEYRLLEGTLRKTQ